MARGFIGKCEKLTAALTMGIIIISQQAAAADSEDRQPDVRIAKLTQDPNAEKIGTALLHLEKQQQLPGVRGQKRTLASGKSGLLVEAILTQSDAATITKLAVPGVSIAATYPQFQRATLEVSDLGALHKLAAIPQVCMLRAVHRPHTRIDYSGAVNGHNRKAMNAQWLVNPLNVTGAGQTVGIISDSFAATSDVRDDNTVPAAGVAGNLTGARNQDSGDLPGVVQILADDPRGSDEGAAMGELIHDVAPGAALAFHTAGNSEPDFATAIRHLRTEAGATILVDDIGFPDEPYYQTGIGAQAAMDAVRAQVPYFSAAGNDENRCLRQPYKNIRGPQTDPKAGRKVVQFADLHDWGGGNAFLPVTVGPDDYAIIILQWNQPFQSLNSKVGCRVDFDMYAVDAADPQLLSTTSLFSQDIQGKGKKGKGDALEFLVLENPNPSQSRTYYVVVDHILGSFDKIPQDNSTPLEITLMVPFSGDVTIGGINNNTSAFGGPTIFGHVQAAGVISVAALPWWESSQFNPAFAPTANIDPESYSSRGGYLTVFFNRIGQLAPSTTFSPIISSVDGGSTSFFYSSDTNLPAFLDGVDGEFDGDPNFFGTSAAAPSAAGAAALLKELNPTLSGRDMISVLAGSAVDVTGARAAVGNDDVSGWGLIDALASAGTLANQPNLAPYTPPGLSGAFIVNQVQGATADGPISKRLPSYATIGVQNNGPADSVFGFVCGISIDGVEVATRTVPVLNSGANTTFVDIPLPRVKAGNHAFTLTLDSTDTVVETSNADNIITKLITVTK